jgi:hypothetical protein
MSYETEMAALDSFHWDGDGFGYYLESAKLRQKYNMPLGPDHIAALERERQVIAEYTQPDMELPF